jgi:hypothetical protein
MVSLGAHSAGGPPPRPNPARPLWPCPGTPNAAPGAPPLAGLASKTLCAGEIAALLLGARGVAMVQLHIGWAGARARNPPANRQGCCALSDPGTSPRPRKRRRRRHRWDRSVPTPLHNPLALRGLRAALADPEVSAFVSRAPGGLGLSLILAARRAPFRQWGAHLASFGAQVGGAGRAQGSSRWGFPPAAPPARGRGKAGLVSSPQTRERPPPRPPRQASLVADSPYYKLLIGRALGYSHENVLHHIRVGAAASCLGRTFRRAAPRSCRGGQRRGVALLWHSIAAFPSQRARFAPPKKPNPHPQTTNGAGHPSPEVVAAVEAELSKLSPEPPALPWRSGIGSGSGSSSGGGGGGMRRGRSGRPGAARRR